jgi:hypothetical protein
MFPTLLLLLKRGSLISRFVGLLYDIYYLEKLTVYTMFMCCCVLGIYLMLVVVSAAKCVSLILLKGAQDQVV